MNLHLIYKFFGELHKHGWISFILLGLISFFLGLKGFIDLSENSKFESSMIIQSIVLSFGDLPDDKNIWIFAGKLFWFLTFASAAVSLLLRDWSQKQLFNSIKTTDHTAIIGLGKLSHNYVYDLDNKNTLIYNNNSKTILSSDFMNDNYAIKDISEDEIFNDLNISSMSSAVINTGNDRKNINIAFEIIQSYLDNKCTHNLRLIVRIEKKELNALFMSNKVFTSKDSSFKSSNIEIKTYSFFEECAVNLFEENYIDGDDFSIINSHDEYSIAILGEGELASKIIYEACKIAHLPNENILNIYLVGIQNNNFLNSLYRQYPGIDSIPTIKIHKKELNYNSLDFYKDQLWDIKNLTNIIICHDDENINLEIASSMQDKTFLQKSEVKTKVLFGVYTQGSIAKKLDDDDANFNIFKSFGDSKKILTVENLFDDKSHMIAKLVNYTYDLLANENYETPYNPGAKFEYEKNKKEIDSKWFNKSGFTDKSSSLAQAKHINMKLKTLGLKAVKIIDNKSLEELIKINREILETRLDIKFEGNYEFPNNFDDTVFNKMIRLEHNRWNAYHYLNGWIYDEKKDKTIKKHDCLLPLIDFPNYFKDEKKLQDLIEWDIYATVYIPNYLAEAGYKIEKYNDNKNYTSKIFSKGLE